VGANASTYEFFVVAGKARTSLGKLEAKAISTESIWGPKGAHFTGAFVALYASGNGQRASAPADFDWFEYAPGDD
jgi:alpha-N-arabinofuranosidase